MMEQPPIMLPDQPRKQGSKMLSITIAVSGFIVFFSGLVCCNLDSSRSQIAWGVFEIAGIVAVLAGFICLLAALAAFFSKPPEDKIV